MDNTLANALGNVSGQDVFLITEPEILDFTESKPSTLRICGASIEMQIPLPYDKRELFEKLAGLPLVLGAIIGWNIKPFFSYYLARTGKAFKFDTPIWDLKIIESFLGKSNLPPKSFAEAVSRLKLALASPCWKKFKNIYKEVYIPLLLDVYPSIETNGLLHKPIKRLVYSYYELEGQVNGRCSCPKVLSHSFMPHNMGEKEKNNLSPGEDNIFMYFDFRNMEVSVLQWLSEDPILGEIIASRKNVYAKIWRKIINEPDLARATEMGKGTFLPVVFGLGPLGLAKKLKINKDIAITIINKLNHTFSKSLGWVKQQLDKDGFATDHFGRRRQLDESEILKVRNFVIQSPASIICLRKLAKLHEVIKNLGKLVYHVHDGYCIVIKKHDWNKAFKLAITTLESEDELFPNLKLTASCMAGADLNNMKSIRLK